MKRPLLAFCLGLVILGVVRLLLFGPPGGTYLSEGYASVADGSVITVTGIVSQKSETGFTIKSVVLHRTVGGLRQDITLNEKLNCEWEEAEELLLGSSVCLSGKLRYYSPARNYGEFDGARYWRIFGIGGRLQNVTILQKGASGNSFFEFLYRMKRYWKERLYRVFPEREASVISTMLLGERQELDPEIKALYKRNGVVHILSISGLHITILGMGLYRLLRRIGCPVWLAALIGGIVLVVYGILTGLGISAVRAIGMYCIRMLGEATGRTYDMLTALGVMAAILVCVNPLYLTHCGFLLSFACVAAMGVVLPALQRNVEAIGIGQWRGGQELWEQDSLSRRFRLLLRKTIRSVMTESLPAGISVFLTTLPIQLYFYYEIPVYSTLLNILILPFLGAALICGLIAMLIPGCGVIGTGTVVILKAYERLCLWFDQLPFHTWNPGCPQGWQIAVYYAVLGAVLWSKYTPGRAGAGNGRVRNAGNENARSGNAGTGNGGNGNARSGNAGTGNGGNGNARSGNAGTGNGGNGNARSGNLGTGSTGAGNFEIGNATVACAGILRMFALFFALSLFALQPRRNAVTMLDVGQGDCLFLETENGEYYLYDCGSTSRSNVGQYVLIPYLKYRGVSRLDGIFVSHADADHVSGLKELLQLADQEHIRIGRIYLPAIASSIRAREFGELEELVSGETGAVRNPEAVRNLEAMRDTETGRQENPRDHSKIVWLSADDRLKGEKVEFLCLHPGADYRTDDSNQYSLCLYVQLGEKANGLRLLLTGDVEGTGEQELIAKLQQWKISGMDVLKVAHHGSNSTTSEEFLETVSARIALISAGAGNRYGHPHGETIERLETVGTNIYRTDRYGAIIVETKEGNVEIRGYLCPK